MDLISDPANLPTFLEEPKFQRKIAFPHLMQTRLDKYYVFICFYTKSLTSLFKTARVVTDNPKWQLRDAISPCER